MITALLALVVLLPPSAEKATVEEARKLQPAVTFIHVHLEDQWIYEGDEESVMVSYDRGVDPDVPTRLAVVRATRRHVIVYVARVEQLVKQRRYLHRAIGRMIAHEVEHIRRQSPEHDETGWFAEYLGVQELTAPSWKVSRSGGRTGSEAAATDWHVAVGPAAAELATGVQSRSCRSVEEVGNVQVD